MFHVFNKIWWVLKKSWVHHIEMNLYNKMVSLWLPTEASSINKLSVHVCVFISSFNKFCKRFCCTSLVAGLCTSIHSFVLDSTNFPFMKSFVVGTADMLRLHAITALRVRFIKTSPYKQIRRFVTIKQQTEQGWNHFYPLLFHLVQVFHHFILYTWEFGNIEKSNM
jgi:hypothetical protein